VLVCSDVVERHGGQLCLDGIAAALRRDVPGARVYMLRDLCSRSSGLNAAVQELGARRVVIGCCGAATRRQRVLGALRSGSAHPAGVQVVDLMPGRRAGAEDIAEQSVARLRAALARVSCADLDAPVSDCAPALGSVLVSRRDLFGLRYLARRPVAAWAAERCAGQGPSRPCVAACPHGALSVAGTAISVDPAACTGCGACVRVCRPGAMALSGASVGELEAAALVIVQEARRLGLGVAIACSAAGAELAVGGEWLPLEVPSLEMVTAGWVLKLVAAGVSVTLIACEDGACAGRGRDLMGFCGNLLDEAAPQERSLLVRPCARPPNPAPAVDGEDSPGVVELREPRATVAALTALMPEGNATWRLESPLAPLGEVTVDPTCCSGCRCCAKACPTGALGANQAEDGALALTFAMSQCHGCGACVGSCPEGAVSLRRAVSSSSLVAERRVLAEVAGGGCCAVCGKPLAGGLVAQAVAAHLATSHPQIAGRLKAADRCADCLLRA
jgi:ferredoxin